MPFQKSIPILFCSLVFAAVAFSQELSIKHISNLNPSQEINHIYKLITHNNDGLLLADARFEKGDLDGLLIQFDLTGKVIKEVRVGKVDSYERIVGISKYADGYYLLMNSVSRSGLASLLLYQLDENLAIASIESIGIEGMSTANAMIYNPAKNSLELVVSISDAAGNTFPRLVHFELDSKSQSHIDFDSKNRPEKVEDLEVYISVIDKDGNVSQQRMTSEQLREKGLSSQVANINKECLNIQFANDGSQELLLTGLENSKTITDFWVAKILNNELVWEDRFPTELGGDEGKAAFKLDNGYLIFGHEYTKKRDSYYSYRALLLNNDGKEIAAEKFDTGQKDWFKDVVQLGQKHFLMFGQTESITLAKSFSDMEKINTSNLWAILVNDKGKIITDYLHESESLDEAFVMSKLESGNALIVYKSNDTLKIGQLHVAIP